MTLFETVFKTSLKYLVQLQQNSISPHLLFNFKKRMKRFYQGFRPMLFTLALGLMSVYFFNSLSESWNEVSVKLPQVETESPLYVLPFETPKLATDEELFQGRDLSLYDFGLFPNCDVSLSKSNKCRKERKKAREFIWNHWRAKKRTYIIYDWTGHDADTRIFIEPDKSGKWVIVWRRKDGCGDCMYQIGEEGIKFYLGVIERKFYSIKYKRAQEDEFYGLEKGERYLSLIDENGEEMLGDL